MNSLERRQQDSLTTQIFNLINKNKLEEAFEKADQEPVPFARMNWFGIIADKYMQRNDLDLAYRAAQRMPGGMDRTEETLHTLAKKFMLQNQVDKAIAAANSIENNGTKSKALREIGQELARQNEISKALEVTALIPLATSRTVIITTVNNSEATATGTEVGDTI
jgi:hypothetical protein